MDRAHDHLRGMDDARSLLFRSAHMYLLFGSVVNFALGLYLGPAAGWRRWVRAVGSALGLAVPFLSAAGFSVKPSLSRYTPPFSRPTASSCLAGMLLPLACRTATGGTSRAEPSRAPDPAGN